MGRIFSTTYRVFLAIMSIAAMVLSFMSATSCTFLTYNHEHQYASNNRFLQATSMTGADDNNLQDEAKELLDTVTKEIEEESNSPNEVDGDEETTGTRPTVSAGVLAGNEDAVVPYGVSEDMIVDEKNAVPPTGIPEIDLSDIVTPTLPAAKDDLDDPTSGVLSTQDLGGESTTESTKTSLSYPRPSPTGSTPEAGERVPTSGSRPSIGSSVPREPPSTGSTPEAPTAGERVPISETRPTPGSSVPRESPSTGSTPEAPTAGERVPVSGSSTRPTLGTSVPREPSPSFGDVNSAAKPTEPDVVVTGEAGLFCDGQKKFDVRKVWKGSFDELEEEIGVESENNQSEELARNAVIASAVFGTIIAFIVVLECVLGWRMCLERYIIGLIAICASISQGVTFLFFNSKRYCDGDIVHEIINQEPCFIAQGGIYSAVAVALYGIIMIMACRLPSDDPYGLCNKKSRSSTGSTQLSQNESGLVMGDKSRSWISAEKKIQIDEENEII